MDEIIHAILEYIKNNSFADIIFAAWMFWFCWGWVFDSDDEDPELEELREENEDLRETIKDLRKQVRELKKASNAKK